MKYIEDFYKDVPERIDKYKDAFLQRTAGGTACDRKSYGRKSRHVCQYPEYTVKVQLGAKTDDRSRHRPRRTGDENR